MRNLYMVLLGAALFVSPLCFGAEQLRCPARVTQMVMEKGHYSPMQGATFGLQDFSATMVARGKTSPLCFMRTTEVQQGEVFISSESLTALFAQKIQQSQSKMSDIKVEIKDNEAHLSGKTKKGISIPFEIQGPVSTDGKVLLLQAKKIKATGIPVKGLLGMLGKHLSSIIGSESMNGVSAKGDTLIFEPAKIAHVTGRLASAQLTPKGLVIVFAKEPPAKPGGAQPASVKQTAAH